jgi:hypothetical protein
MAHEGIQYRPFEEKDEIRLIVLHSGASASPLRCSLHHACLSSNPKYDALSYVWGAELSTDFVELDETCHIVGKNLFQALKHLRRHDEDQFLWVDALCINQANTQERGHQVAQMGLIYSRARLVRIWLGLLDEAGPEIEAAFRDLSELNRLLLRQDSNFNAYDTVGISRLAGSDEDDLEVPARRGLKHLCSREYWNRLWIIQEIILASSIQIHCGNLSSPWNPFRRAVLCHEQELGFRDLIVVKLCRRKDIEKSDLSSTKESLLSLMMQHREAKCSDIRDKVYGIHSTAWECCREAVPADYSCTAYELSRRLLQHEIQCHSESFEKGLTVFAASRLHQLLVGGAAKQGSSTNAFEGGSPYETTYDPSDYQNQSVTSVKIVEYGTVRWVSPLLGTFSTWRNDVQVPVSLLLAWTRLNCNPLATVRRSQYFLGTEGEFGDDDSIGTPLPSLELISLEPTVRIDGYSPETRTNQALTMLRGFLSYMEHQVQIHFRLENSVLFWAGNSSVDIIGLAPASTECNDIICNFPKTDIIAVIRNDGFVKKVIGRAVEVSNIVSARSYLKRELYSSVDVSVRTLQILSKVLTDPELQEERHNQRLGFATEITYLRPTYDGPVYDGHQRTSSGYPLPLSGDPAPWEFEASERLTEN